VTAPERTAVVLAAGGERAVAWEVGVLAGLADRGFDARHARAVVGTSAGAVVAARCAVADPRSAADAIAARRAGAPGPRDGAAELFDRLAAVWVAAGGGPAARRVVARLAVQRSPGGEAAFVARVAEALPVRDWPSRLRVVATDTVTGDRAVLHPGSRVPLADAVAASQAVPLRCPPVTLGGRPHVDGALGSATNADVLLADVKDGQVDHVLVVSPAGGATMIDRLWAAMLEGEVAALTAAGAAVTVIAAGHTDLAAMGPDPMSGAMASLAVAAGRSTGARAGIGWSAGARAGTTVAVR
jgi:NTE family protein